MALKPYSFPGPIIELQEPEPDENLWNEEYFMFKAIFK